jgi:hypothetical protein
MVDRAATKSTGAVEENLPRREMGFVGARAGRSVCAKFPAMVNFGVPRGVGRFVERNEESWD